MSVQVNTYVMTGALLPYDAYASRSDDFRFSAYEDNAFKGIHHHNDLCILPDGMSGKYVAIGKVHAKSDEGQGLDEPVIVPDLTAEEKEAMRSKIAALFSDRQIIIQNFVVSHYR